MTRTRFLLILAISVAVHSLFVFVVAKHDWRSLQSRYNDLQNHSVQVKIIGSGEVPGDPSAQTSAQTSVQALQPAVAPSPVKKASRSKPSSGHKRADITSLMVIRPRNEVAPSGAASASGHTQTAEEARLSGWLGATNSMSGVFGRGNYAGGKAMSGLQRLAQKLDEAYTFPYNLAKDISGGDVEIQFALDAQGKLDKQKVRGRGDQKYLLVYALQTLEQVLAKDDAQFSDVSFQSPLGLSMKFSSGRDPYRDAYGSNGLKGRTIHVSRYYKKSSKLDLGVAEFYLTGPGTDPKPWLHFAFEPESLLSASHRKKFGWSGTKVLEGEKAAA